MALAIVLLYFVFVHKAKHPCPPSSLLSRATIITSQKDLSVCHPDPCLSLPVTAGLSHQLWWCNCTTTAPKGNLGEDNTLRFSTLNYMFPSLNVPDYEHPISMICNWILNQTPLLLALTQAQTQRNEYRLFSPQQYLASLVGGWAGISSPSLERNSAHTTFVSQPTSQLTLGAAAAKLAPAARWRVIAWQGRGRCIGSALSWSPDLWPMV